MPMTLNQTPLLLVKILSKMNSVLSLAAEKVWQEKKHSCFPENVLVKQDQNLQHYVACLAKLLFDEDPKDIDVKINWQFKQVYRILNAMIDSINVTEEHKKYLIEFRKRFETVDVVSDWLNEVNINKTSPVVCSGHAYAMVEDGIATIPSHSNTKVVTYAETGATVLNDLGDKIENQRYNPLNVTVQKGKETAQMPQDRTFKFPFVLTENSLNCIPNFRFSGADESDLLVTPGRVIELETGRVLEKYENDDFSQLNDIIRRHKGREIHWAACSILYAENTSSAELKEIGRYPHYSWTLLEKNKRRKERKNHPYLRLFKPAVNDGTMPVSNDKNMHASTSLSHSMFTPH